MMKLVVIGAVAGTALAKGNKYPVYEVECISQSRCLVFGDPHVVTLGGQEALLSTAGVNQILAYEVDGFAISMDLWGSDTLDSKYIGGITFGQEKFNRDKDCDKPVTRKHTFNNGDEVQLDFQCFDTWKDNKMQKFMDAQITKTDYSSKTCNFDNMENTLGVTGVCSKLPSTAKIDNSTIPPVFPPFNPMKNCQSTCQVYGDPHVSAFDGTNKKMPQSVQELEIYNNKELTITAKLGNERMHTVNIDGQVYTAAETCPTLGNQTPLKIPKNGTNWTADIELACKFLKKPQWFFNVTLTKVDTATKTGGTFFEMESAQGATGLCLGQQ